MDDSKHFPTKQRSTVRQLFEVNVALGVGVPSVKEREEEIQTDTPRPIPKTPFTSGVMTGCLLW